MGIIVKLIGSGLGLASEAIHDYRAHSRSQPGRDLPPSPAGPSSPRPLAPCAPLGEAPPEYVEVADEVTADRLVRGGQAERVAEHTYDNYLHTSRSKAAEAGYVEGDDDYPSDDDSDDAVAANDEAAWELDDMAERVAPLSHAGSETSLAAGEGESEEAKVKKEEQMIRDLLRMAGTPPQPVRRLPCPVIIPQRRPRNKDRGFVRAYAPVLDECGIGQDVFLKFLKDWLAASKVRNYLPPLPPHTQRIWPLLTDPDSLHRGSMSYSSPQGSLAWFPSWQPRSWGPSSRLLPARRKSFSLGPGGTPFSTVSTRNCSCPVGCMPWSWRSRMKCLASSLVDH